MSLYNDSLAWLEELTPEARDALLVRIQGVLARNKIEDYYPAAGPLRRELYPKHQEFLAAGKKHRVRSMIAANRVGKSEGCGLYETVLHMTGKYPDWWRGKRFERPVRVWVAGDTGKTLREILQPKLLGPWGAFGTGLVPANCLVSTTTKQGVAEAIDTFTVLHVSGGTSHGVFKSYDQKRQSFQGSEQDVILLDEEPPLDIYTECLLRTMTTAGIVMITFTPLLGMTKLIKQLRESGSWTINATWDDVPHLSKQEKDDLWASIPAYMRDARTKGIPQRGSGVVFPVSEDSILVEPFKVPDEWAQIGGIDFGWDHPTAAAKLAHDRDSDVLYVTAEYSEREKTPLLFAAGVKPWGTWLPWAWPHDGLQHDKGSGDELADLYRKQGMNMLQERATFADGSNGVEAGIMGMLDLMQAGRFKVFTTCPKWLAEFRDYYRKDGLIVKDGDDLMSATRYAYMMRRFATYPPRERKRDNLNQQSARNWRTL